MAPLSRLRTAKLNQRVAAGAPDAAGAPFDSLREQQSGGFCQVGLMLKACGDGAAMQALLRRAEAAGVSLDASSYTLLISELQIASRSTAVQAVVSALDARCLAATE